MGRQAAICLAGVAAIGAVLTAASPAAAIVGGTPVADGQLPFVAKIELREPDGTWSHVCGGSLVDSRVVATASHCLPVDPQDEIRLVLGRTDANTTTGTVVNDDRFSAYLHPSFTGQTNTDLGLVVLDEELRYDTAALPRPNTRPLPGEHLQAAGWGSTDAQSPVKSSQLLGVTLPVTEFDTEGGIWDEEFLCAGTPEKRVTHGDSGGPLYSVSGSGEAVVHGLVTGETSTCYGLFTNLADPTVWEPFREPLASHGLSHVLPSAEPAGGEG